MKKFLLIACSIGALMACNREEIPRKLLLNEILEVNEASLGTIPVHLSISKSNIYTKGTAPYVNESALANVRLTIKGSNSTSPDYTQTYEMGDESEVIVNIPYCERADFTIESGETNEEGKFLTTLEGQKEYLYAKGKISLTWEQMQSQDSPFEIVISRMINKITIEKISLNWSNENYDRREFRIKKIYLSDVPRNYMSDYNKATAQGYNSDYAKEREDISVYNFGGLDGYSLRCVSDNKMYYTPVYRLDDQLVDEPDAVLTKSEPYVVPHTFYAYLSNSKESIHISTASPTANYVNLYIPATSIVIEAELDGEPMYYRLPIAKDTEKAPTNTHVIFQELSITGLGSSTLHGPKAFENISVTFEDWTIDHRTGITKNL
jgi:hypothetical protein